MKLNRKAQRLRGSEAQGIAFHCLLATCLLNVAPKKEMLLADDFIPTFQSFY